MMKATNRFWTPSKWLLNTSHIRLAPSGFFNITMEIRNKLDVVSPSGRFAVSVSAALEFHVHSHGGVNERLTQ